MKTTTRYAVASATAALALVSLMGAGIANAAPSPILDGGPTQGTIKIHKIKGVESGTRADGTPLSDQARQALGEPLANVTFDLYKIDGIDLHSTAGMAIAEKAADITLTPEIVASGKLSIDGKDYTFSKTTSVTTNATGDASATVELGVYVVNENLAKYPGDASAITPAAPFLAIMPQTNPRNHSDWMYDLDIYPKNTENSIEKTVKDGNAGTQNQDGYKVGENLTYTLASTVLAGDSNGDGQVNGADLGYYYVQDTLPEGTEYVSSKVSVGDTALTEGADYVLSQTGNTLGWSVTSDGLNKLAANTGKKFTVEIVTRVAANNITGELKNQAWFIPSNAWLINNGNKPGTPGNTPPPISPRSPPRSSPSTVTSCLRRHQATAPCSLARSSRSTAPQAVPCVTLTPSPASPSPRRPPPTLRASQRSLASSSPTGTTVPSRPTYIPTASSSPRPPRATTSYRAPSSST